MTVRSLVKSLAQKRPPFCSPEFGLFDAAVEIARLNVNALAVVDHGRLAGILTDHDIIRALADTGPEFGNQRVSDWMTAPVVTCGIDTRLSAALNLMARHRIRHLVVTNGDSVVTVLASKDVLAKIHADDELELNVLRDMARVNRGVETA